MANTIRFDSKFQIVVQYSIRFEMKKHYSHSTKFARTVNPRIEAPGFYQYNLPWPPACIQDPAFIWDPASIRTCTRR